jgi:amidohydrolase
MVFIFSFVVACYAAGEVTPTEQNLLSAIDNSRATVFDIEKQIWEFKELGMEEFKSSALLMDMFEKEGFKVQRGLTGKDLVNGVDVDIPTGFIATYEGIGKGATVALLPEYDALPNGHACGHNLISGSCYAAAMGIKEYLKTNPGTLKVIGCPAEETLVIKQFYADADLYKGIDVAYSPHGGSEWKTVLNAKAMVDSDRIGQKAKGIIFRGKASHASSAPWVGKSALDAVMLMAMGLEFMREHIYDSDRIHYIITNGGRAANVVPEEATADVWLRSDDSNQLAEMIKRAEDIIKGAALMTNTTYEYIWATITYAPVPVPKLSNQAADAGAALGIPRESFNMKPSSEGSTDAGNAGYVMPLAYVGFPIDTKPVDGHTDEFCVQANTDYAMDQSILAGKVMALSATRLLTNETDLKAIKDEFASYFSSK